jgi:hypothetical protein
VAEFHRFQKLAERSSKSAKRSARCARSRTR